MTALGKTKMLIHGLAVVVVLHLEAAHPNVVLEMTAILMSVHARARKYRERKNFLRCQTNTKSLKPKESPILGILPRVTGGKLKVGEAPLVLTDEVVVAAKPTQYHFVEVEVGELSKSQTNRKELSHVAKIATRLRLVK